MRPCWSHRARSIRGASMNSFHARRASNPRQHGSALRWVALSASTRATCMASRMNAGTSWMVGTGHRNPACRSTSSSACQQGTRVSADKAGEVQRRKVGQNVNGARLAGRNGALWFMWSRGRRWARTSMMLEAATPGYTPVWFANAADGKQWARRLETPDRRNGRGSLAGAAARGPTVERCPSCPRAADIGSRARQWPHARRLGDSTACLTHPRLHRSQFVYLGCCGPVHGWCKMHPSYGAKYVV